MKQQPVDGTGRRKTPNPEDLLTRLHQDTGRAWKLFRFAVASFLRNGCHLIEGFGRRVDDCLGFL